jgi:hypothetical protein
VNISNEYAAKWNWEKKELWRLKQNKNENENPQKNRRRHSI